MKIIDSPTLLSMPELTTDQLVAKSSLYKQFITEREEILRYKWIKSEEAGHDIGFEKALVDWTMNHRALWREQSLKK